MSGNVNYEELTPAEFRVRLADAPIAYLPLGTLEWHGEHLPLGSDGIQSTGFFSELAHKVGGVVLQAVFMVRPATTAIFVAVGLVDAWFDLRRLRAHDEIGMER